MSAETRRNSRFPTASFIGSGAIGSLLAAQCQRINLPFDMWWRVHSNTPLVVKKLDGNSESLSASHPHTAQLLVIATKAWQVKDAVLQYKEWLSPDTCVVLMHNGAGTEDWITSELASQPILRMTTSKAALKMDPFLVVETGDGTTQAGWLRKPNTQQRLQLEQWCQQLLPDCQWFDDIRQPIWQKLAVNSVINPLTALHNCKNGDLLQPQFKGIIEKLIAEFLQVSNAAEISMDKHQIETMVWSVITKTADNYSSMHQDIANKRPTELDYINGFLLVHAASNGLVLPANEELVSRIKALEKEYS